MEKSEKIAVYAGTFDPLTKGHISIIERAATMFDTIIIAVAQDTGKKTLFSLQERVQLAHAYFIQSPNIIVESFDGLLVDYAASKGACVLIRGLRAVSDYEHEFQLALMNRKLCPQLETVFLMASLQWMYVSSTIIKEVSSLGGNIHGMVTPCVLEALREKYDYDDSWSLPETSSQAGL